MEQGVSLVRSNIRLGFLIVLGLISHKQTKAQHTEGPIEWHIQQLFCAHIRCLYYIQQIICWYQKFTLQNSTMSLLFKNNWLVEVIYHLIRFNKINFSLQNKNNSDRYSVNAQNKQKKDKSLWKLQIGYPLFLKQLPYFTNRPYLSVNLNPHPLLGKLLKIHPPPL